MTANNREWGLVAAIILTGCGYVGEPLYPALNIPNRIVDLTAVQRGSNIDVSFTIPALTTEGLVVKQIGGVELRAGPSKSEPFRSEEWAAAATKIPVPPPEKPGFVHVSVPVQAFVGQSVIVGVRVLNTKGRASDWSNFRTLDVKAPLATPTELTATAVAQGVLVKWKAVNETSFRVYRQAPNEPRATQLVIASEPQYLDTTTEYGKSYQYWVEGLEGDMVSELAGPFEIKPEDKFAPAVPAGLIISAGLQTLELAWERNTEADFKGYRVYRATGDGNFEKIADLIEAPSFSDNKIESGKRYRYAVSAVDQSGNESDKSAPVEAAAP